MCDVSSKPRSLSLSGRRTAAINRVKNSLRILRQECITVAQESQSDQASKKLEQSGAKSRKASLSYPYASTKWIVVMHEGLATVNKGCCYSRDLVLEAIWKPWVCPSTESVSQTVVAKVPMSGFGVVVGWTVVAGGVGNFHSILLWS